VQYIFAGYTTAQLTSSFDATETRPLKKQTKKTEMQEDTHLTLSSNIAVVFIVLSWSKYYWRFDVVMGSGSYNLSNTLESEKIGGR
jgi:hypothetical protein